MINTVTKRDGSSEGFNVEKIKQVISWACEGLDISPLELEAKVTGVFTEGINTLDIQNNLINTAVSLINPLDFKSSDWKYVAGRLHMMNIWKETSKKRGYYYDEYNSEGAFYYSTYPLLVQDMTSKGLYDKTILENYSLDELGTAGEWIFSKLDLDYDIAGARALSNKYLIEGELPQEAFLTCALLLASVEKKSERLKYAKHFYEVVSQRKISLATPLLANLRKPKGNLSSCFILSINDNIESIFDAVKDVALISKQGGGVGIDLSHIRAAGSTIQDKPNTSKGVVPLVKVINDTATYIDQLGKRSGAVTTALPIWHLDIPEFLELQTEHGDMRAKAYDVFLQVIMHDIYMQAVIHNKEWYLVDPYEVKKVLGLQLPKLWGEEFNKAYALVIEAVKEGRLKLFKKVNAKDIFKQIMKVLLERGTPYLTFKDTLNKYNPNQHDGYIPSLNLCVAPETKILTDKGYFEIHTLENQIIEVWNGEQWSETKVIKTGENQELLKINLSNGESLETTYYHKFWLQNSYQGNPIKVEAKDLKIGDKLIKFDLPVIEGTKEFQYAYTHGAYCGDGSFDKAHNLPEIDLYGIKKELLPYIQVRNKTWSNGSITLKREELAIYNDLNSDRIVVKLPKDIKSRFVVPNAEYYIQSRLDWFAGLCDTNGTIARNGSNESLQISSTNKKFLLEIRLMLQTLGVESKVVDLHPEGYRKLPDGKGGSKNYFCKRTYRLLVSSSGLYKLSELGFKTNRLQWKVRKPQRNAEQFINVTFIEHTNRISDTFCFNEPIRHMGMFNGILTGNCVESTGNVVPDLLSHICNLDSINLANVNEDEHEYICSLAVRILDNAIDLTAPPILEAKAHNERYRLIGVGMMGLADWLAKRELSYSASPTSTAYPHQKIKELFEDLSYYCTKASADLAVERGAYKAFKGSLWSKGWLIGKPVDWFTQNASQPIRWKELSKQVQSTGIRNGTLTAIAPNTSSSLVQGCTASFLPTFSKFFTDKHSKGADPIIPPFIKQAFWFYPEAKSVDPQRIVEIVSECIQPWIDTGISMELLFDLNNPQVNAKFIFDTLIMAWQKECKAVYYVRSIKKNENLVKDTDDCTYCAN